MQDHRPEPRHEPFARSRRAWALVLLIPVVTLACGLAIGALSAAAGRAEQQRTALARTQANVGALRELLHALPLSERVRRPQVERLGAFAASRLAAVTDGPADGPLAGALRGAATEARAALARGDVAGTRAAAGAADAALGRAVAAQDRRYARARARADAGIPALVLLAAALVLGLVRRFDRLRDAGAERRAAALRRELDRDVLTGLRNRRCLERRLGGLDPARGAVLALLDLDGFKALNDRAGHEAGDHALRAVARVLVGTAGDDAVYRLGGDELCLLTGPDGRSIVDAARSALDARAPELGVTCSFGVVELPGETADVREALRLADRRMYAEKGRGGRRQAAAASAARNTERSSSVDDTTAAPSATSTPSAPSVQQSAR